MIATPIPLRRLTPVTRATLGCSAAMAAPDNKVGTRASRHCVGHSVVTRG
ncbi:MAG: hypothetical protein ACRDQ5_00245 [Sciscionella sp.]